MLLSYLLAYNNAFLGCYEESQEVPLLRTQGEIRTRYGNRPTLSPPLNHTWLVHSDSTDRPHHATGPGSKRMVSHRLSFFFLFPKVGELRPSSQVQHPFLPVFKFYWVTAVVPQVWSRDPWGGRGKEGS